MNELDLIKNSVNPNEILLVLDSMIGQDAINVIIGFNDKLPLTGAVLTKMDGDTKGGVALSLRSLTNVPIKFLGTSEKMDGLELFDRHRMANRILGMGDILSIVDKVSDILDEESIAVSKKMQKGDFDLEDFLAQLKQIKKMGPLENVIKMMPGANKLKDVKVNPKDLLHTEAIILSMTPYERKHPDILKASRKIRIAKGSGLEVSDVNRLLKQYEQMKVIMKQIKNGNLKLPF
jgi:signal recognition particle subunit SRP54